MRMYYDFDTRKYTVRFTMAEVLPRLELAGRGKPMEYDLTFDAEALEDRTPAPEMRVEFLESSLCAIQRETDVLWHKLSNLKKEL